MNDRPSDPKAPESRFGDAVLGVVLDVVDAVVVVMDRTGTVVAFNRACERTTGFSAAEIIGTKLWDRLIPADELDGVRSVFDELRAGEFPNAHENDWLTKDGARRRIAWSNTAALAADGNVEWVIGTGLDVTEARRNATALAASEERYRTILETANDGVWITDTTGRTVFMNRRMADMLGCTVDESLDGSVWDFVDPDWKEIGEAHLTRRMNGISEQFDFLFRRTDGSPLYVIVSTSPITDAGGQVVGGLGMVTDITERRLIEERQRRLMAELDHRVKNALATVVALTEETSRSTASVEVFRDTLGARIRLMARAHEALARSHWESVCLDELAYEVLSPFAADDRVRVSGPEVRLPPFAALPLALTLHELTTNSVKHGALSIPGGRVALEWRFDTPDQVSIGWRESGGPRVVPTPAESTGLTLVRDFVEYELAGKVSLDFHPSGVSCDLEIPLRTRSPSIPGTTH